jgi:hypothetical protein
MSECCTGSRVVRWYRFSDAVAMQNSAEVKRLSFFVFRCCMHEKLHFVIIFVNNYYYYIDKRYDTKEAKY